MAAGRGAAVEDTLDVGVILAGRQVVVEDSLGCSLGCSQAGILGCSQVDSCMIA